MSGITITHKGNYYKATQYLERLRRSDYMHILNEYGERGVQVLSAATPVRSGETASSWSYSISTKKGGYSLDFYNSSSNEGLSIVILNQYGHATKDGGWVQGVDFINPAIQPVFEELVNAISKEVRG